MLRHLAAGRSTPEVAKRLSLSPKTVRTHVQNLLRKLGMHSRLEVVVYADKKGLA